MTSVIVKVAKAVAASLNGAAVLPSGVSAAMLYRPDFELSDLSGYKVSVVPSSQTVTTADRSSSFFECVVDVGVQRRVASGGGSDIDDLLDLVQGIVDHFVFQRLPTAPEARWLRVENDPVLAPETLDEHQVATSVVRLTYQIRR